MEASKEMEAYMKAIEKKVEKEYEIANNARSKGYDPETKVDSPLAKNMVERVEGLISAVAPQLIGSGVTERMFELEKKYGVLDWRVALVISEEVAKEKFCTFTDKREAMEVGIRTGFAYHTLGIVAAPLEGFIRLDLKQRKDGREYFSLSFSGPVRGAGGTGASVCVLIADYVRIVMGYATYDPTEEETKRYVTELNDYHERITNLQYHPSEDEILFLAKHLPVEVAGDPTEKLDVSNYKDLPRVSTNKIRGGMCLVFSMIALKAPKLWKRLEGWNEEMGLDWEFLKEFLVLQKQKKSGEETKEEKPKLTPNRTFIADIVAGRPVLTDPMTFGGFRLRYGRSRTTGYSAAAIHPATMVLLEEFIAIGTQLKVERPGKAASITACDSITGPTVLLTNGNVKYISSVEEANQVKNEVERLLFLGDIMFNYGDFSENGHLLVPVGYCEEWWLQEAEKKGLTLQKEPSSEEAVSLAKQYNLPLHPRYTPYWKGITVDELKELVSCTRQVKSEEGKLVLPKKMKPLLEKIGQEHTTTTIEHVVIEPAVSFLACLGSTKEVQGEEIITALNSISDVEIRDTSGTFVGARMGRPEKAKMRKLTGSPHGLFPVGNEGDRLRSFQSALENGKVTASFALFKDLHSQEETVFSASLHGKNVPLYEDGEIVKPGTKENKKRHRHMSIPIKKYFDACLEHLGMKAYPDLIKGVRGTWSRDHIAEHLSKAILRAKNEVYVNKDGSVRYDMTELPLTHFTPQEVGTPIDLLKKFGYEKDIEGKPLTKENQMLELKPQDVVLPGNADALEEPASEVLFRVSKFVDDLLERLYKLPPYYKLKSKEGLVGQLVIGLAPHISAAMVGRIIGFSQTSGCFAHPLWHAALRRDCDGDEASVSLLLDSLLNFSRQYLPDRIGGRTMDAPLVLTARVIPSEVDDMVQGIDVVSSYPLEFYEAASHFKYPWDVKVEQLGKRLNTPSQYENIHFTRSTTNINNGVLVSAYKTLPSMREKLDGQMKIAEKVAAVNTSQVAKLVIEKHFIKDIKGNLRKFSMQQFRCVKCNEKFRRPPLLGKCTNCNGKILFTISEGSVIKYLEPAMHLAETYNLDAYLKETLSLTKKRIDEVFGKELEKQSSLTAFTAK